ncbi:hypothetical protein KUCAC02_035477, partial [Chaenocephalus aceratus]
VKRKRCLGGDSRLKSRLFAHVQSRRMDEDTMGFLSAGLPCLDRHGNLGSNGQ